MIPDIFLVGFFFLNRASNELSSRQNSFDVGLALLLSLRCVVKIFWSVKIYFGLFFYDVEMCFLCLAGFC